MSRRLFPPAEDTGALTFVGGQRTCFDEGRASASGSAASGLCRFPFSSSRPGTQVLPSSELPGRPANVWSKRGL